MFPAHPRTRHHLQALSLSDRIQIVNPQGYLDFFSLQADALMVLTDSGGVQEETTVLGVPCLTLRENAERPITITEGTNRLVGTDPAHKVPSRPPATHRSAARRLTRTHHREVNCCLNQPHNCRVKSETPQVNKLKALKAIRARRPDGEWIYVILDNLSARKGKPIRKWARRNRVELCFTPTHSSWANPIEAHFGPLREFVLNNSNHPNHVVLTHRLHSHLRWRNANARSPELLAAQRRERARVRAEKGHR